MTAGANLALLGVIYAVIVYGLFVLFVSEIVQVLAVTADVREIWIGSPGNVLFSLDLFNREVGVTEELLRVAGASWRRSQISTSRLPC